MLTEAEIKELLGQKTETNNLDCKESLNWDTDRRWMTPISYRSHIPSVKE